MSTSFLNQAVIRDERESRNLTKTQMAEVLGLDVPNAEQILTDFETGYRQPKGSVLRIYQGLNRQRWAGSHLLSLPSWTLSNDGEVIHHNDWPRFVGRVVPELTHPNQWQFKKASMPSYELDGSGGFHQIVFVMVDEIPANLDIEDLFFDAVRIVESTMKGAA